ncbi:MAG: aldo/keto reductase, partial [Nitrososphaerales archaeon]
FNAQTTFASNDHRSYRQREWLMKGLKKIQPLDYLLKTPSRTMDQTALRFTLMDMGISSVLPTISTMNDLEEYAEASELDDLTEEEFEKINQVYAQEFQAETLSYLMPKSRAN